MIGMLKQSSRHKVNHDFYENVILRRLNVTRQIKEDCECCEIDDG